MNFTVPTEHYGLLAFVFTSLPLISYLNVKNSIKRLSEFNNRIEIRSKRSLLHERYQDSKITDDIDYIIIGSGLSGLTTAAILSRLGYKVLVLEQHHDTLGGGTHMFDLKGFKFDSGLHYTVPWSIPLFALTCLKSPKDCIPFDMMTEDDGTIDKLYLINDNETTCEPFRMKYNETHIPLIYQMFPEEKEGLDQYMSLAMNSMHFVKFFLISRLFPKWLQSIYWKFIPSSITSPANTTAKELLPKIIKNKKLVSLLSSMWIDTGARPDRASFMLTASVFRGISMEGGCYPRGGSTEMAKELVTVLECNGGKAYIRADVKSLVYDDKLNRITGVKMGTGKVINCKKGVVSSTGYVNTMHNLLPENVAKQYNIPRTLPIQQSDGFVMANIGLNCSADVIGATKANTWHLPLIGNDIYEALKEFFADPLKPDCPIPAFITFPSLKDTAHNAPNKTTCQMLIIVEFDWFKRFLPSTRTSEQSMEETDQRQLGYEECKAIWSAICKKIFLRYFPQAEPHIGVFDISTPLTILHYLRGTQGAAVGLDIPPERFCDPVMRDILDPISKVPGLALTGQDTGICGVTLCQLTGVITALRLEGCYAAMKLLMQSIILGDK